MNKNTEQSNTNISEKRKELILTLSKRPELSNSESIQLNSMIIKESEAALRLKGEECDVETSEMGLFQKWKATNNQSGYNWKGKSHLNSLLKMQELGIGYVEGYVVSPQGVRIAHAWNMSLHDWRYIDSTIVYNEGYTYFGCAIPDDKVWDVIHQNGCLSSAILPFLEEI